MARPKQRTPELAEHVLATALRIISRDGLGALSARRLATEADTSAAAVYELFRDKGGVVRAMFFWGFRRLGSELAQVDLSTDAREDLLVLAQRYRTFIREHPALSAVMFSRPFASFDPAAEESAAGAAVRELIVAQVQRAVTGKHLHGDATDIAHAYVALIHGLAAAETSRRLGHTVQAIERRWDLAIRALLAGFNAPLAPRGEKALSSWKIS